MRRLLLRLAIGLALRRSPGNRWRQLSVPLGTLVLTICALFSVAFVSVSQDADENRAARMPVLGKESDTSLRMSIRGERWQGRQFPFVWVDADSKDVAIPPGLDSLPEPGAVVVSPGAAGSGLVEGLGLRVDDAGSGPGGTIGSEGLANASEVLVYARPSLGRDLGAGGSLLNVEGYGPEPSDPTANFETDPAHPSTKTALMGLLTFLIAPALLFAATCAMASSDVRTVRNHQLARMGVPRRALVTLNGLESGLLALPGAMAAVVAWLLIAPQATVLPISGLEVYPNSMALGNVTVAVVALACIGFVVILGACPGPSAATIAQSSQRVEPKSPPSKRALVPLGTVLAILVAAKYSGGTLAIYLLILILVPFALALVVAIPFLVALVGGRLTLSGSPTWWLAGLQLRGNPHVLARPARVLAVVTFVAGASTAWLLAFGVTSGDVQPYERPDAYFLGWRDARMGDLDVVTDALPAALIAPLTTEGRARAILPTCDALSRVLEDDAICAPAGEIRKGAESSLNRLFSIRLGVSSGEQPIITPGEDFDVLIIAPESLSETEIWRQLNGHLPALNLSALQDEPRSPPPMRDWLLAAGLTATILVLLAAFHALGNQALGQKPVDLRLIRLGLDGSQISHYRTRLLLAPLAVAVPLGAFAALVWGWAGQTLDLAKLSLVAVALEAAVLALVCLAWVLTQVRLTRVD
jgi:hypothetical protein